MMYFSTGAHGLACRHISIDTLWRPRFVMGTPSWLALVCCMSKLVLSEGIYILFNWPRIDLVADLQISHGINHRQLMVRLAHPQIRTGESWTGCSRPKAPQRNESLCKLHARQ